MDPPDAPPEFLTTFLAGRDTACPSCGYNLRDLVGTRCPECGELLVMRVGLVEPRQAAPIAGLIGLAAGAGLNGLLLLYIVIQLALYRAGIPELQRIVLLNATGLLVHGGAIAFWLRKWRAIRRLPTTRRWVLVASCWALTLANLLVFSLSIG